MRRPIRKPYTTLLLSCLIVLMATPLVKGSQAMANNPGQYITSTASEIAGDSFYSVRMYSDRIPELQHIISLEVEQEPIRNVLEKIVDKAQLGIAYNAELQSLSEPITLKLDRVTVGKALELALLDTDFEPTISKMREIVVRKKVEPQQPELEAIMPEITGQVVDANDGQPLPGVNVVVQGTNIGTSTDTDGRYSLTVPDDAEFLVYSFVGYQQQVVAIDNRTEINVELEAEVQALDDVVVTSFGLETERKALGYSTQEINSEDLTLGNQSNTVSALSGKVAGVNVTNTGGAPGRSSRIVIRGVNSLDPSADNQPLFVVDGVPIDNSTIESTGTPRGMSNRAADLNPNDIESVNVLKGSAATALYGVRAANGAVIITTKKGEAGDTQINVNSTVGFDRINSYPNFQDVYGQGFSGTSYKHDPSQTLEDAHQPESFWPNWGPEIAS